ncbi:acyl CoA:acetate/3-ketoacid CoA transferase, alpha subunit [Acinetobacter baumannii TCDC-AB0715]|nr:acyl CoA:acetate/3-ketoacid CoA transferase, alpha subunit [Acinetobacter baumannii TCDC-AB0715]
MSNNAGNGDYGLAKLLKAGSIKKVICSLAADVTIAQVSEVVELGGLDPEHIITPGIFVQHVVQVQPAQ